MRPGENLNQQLLKLIHHKSSTTSPTSQVLMQILIWQQFHQTALDYYHLLMAK